MKAVFNSGIGTVDITGIAPGASLAVTVNELGDPVVYDLTDGVAIADSAARCDIEINCRIIFDHTTRRVDRYDTRHLIETGPHADDHADQRASVDRALRYLIARGRIECDADAPHLVRFPKVPK